MPGFAFQRVSYQPSGYQPGYQADAGIQGSGIQEIGKLQGQHRVRGSQYATLVRKPVRNTSHQNATGWELVRVLSARLSTAGQQGVNRRK